ncbi:ATP-binding protein, partial [Glaciecola petra]
QSDNTTVIKVKDRGKGIADDSLNSVLIPFYSTKSNGTGLGLALCREIIDAHHGNIALYNRGNTAQKRGSASLADAEQTSSPGNNIHTSNCGLVVKVTLPIL